MVVEKLADKEVFQVQLTMEEYVGLGFICGITKSLEKVSSKIVRNLVPGDTTQIVLLIEVEEKKFGKMDIEKIANFFDKSTD